MTEHQSDSAWNSPRAWFIMLTVLLLGLGADLASKSIAFSRIAHQPVIVRREHVLSQADPRTLVPRHQPKTIVPGVLDLTLVLNRGAVFGIGAGKRWLFISFTAGAIILGLWMFAAWTKRQDWLAHVSLGLLLAGGLGNLYDRLRFACVRDFIHPLPGLTIASHEVWPYVSNVADALLIFGIIGLMWHLWRTDHPNATQHTDDS